MNSRELTNKELADLLEVTPAKLSRLLRNLGMGILVDEAQRMQVREAWDENRFASAVTVENLKQAYENLK